MAISALAEIRLLSIQVGQARALQVGGRTVQLNGAGIRFKAIFKVYTAGLYLPAKAGTTEAVLRTLEQQCTRATFFIVGRMAHASPGVLRDVEAAGHTVATHSMPPAAPRVCPIMDLVEFTTSFLAWSPNASLIALVSFTSPRGVEVPWALT